MDKILVIGASGFVGGRLARTLAAQGRSVRCLTRAPSKIAALAALGCDVVVGDLLEPASLPAALKDVRAVYVSIHTIGPQPKGPAGEDFMALEMAGLKALVDAAGSEGTPRLIYVTSVGIAPDGPGAWLKGRWACETYLLESSLDVTIIRPGMIVGRGGRGFELLASQARSRIAVGLQGGQGMRCIALDDLVYYLIAVLDDPRTYGRRYDVGNDDVLTNGEILAVNAEILGRPAPVRIAIPNALVAALAPLIERLAHTPKGAIRGMIDSFAGDGRGDPTAIRLIAPRPLTSYRDAAAGLIRED